MPMTVVLWGVWGFESKLLVDRTSPYTGQVLFTLGLLLPALVVGGASWLLTLSTLESEQNQDLDGNGTLLSEVHPRSGTLTTRVALTAVSVPPPNGATAVLFDQCRECPSQGARIQPGAERPRLPPPHRQPVPAARQARVGQAHNADAIDSFEPRFRLAGGRDDDDRMAEPSQGARQRRVIGGDASRVREAFGQPKQVAAGDGRVVLGFDDFNPHIGCPFAGLKSQAGSRVRVGEVGFLDPPHPRFT